MFNYFFFLSLFVNRHRRHIPFTVICLKLSPTANAVFRRGVLREAVSHELTRLSHREREKGKKKNCLEILWSTLAEKNFVSMARKQAYFSEVKFSGRLVYQLMR